MKEIIKMLVVLTLISSVCGALLAYVNTATKELREEQVLQNVQGPAVEKVMAGSTNDLIKGRKKIIVDKEEFVVFVGEKDGKKWGMAYETSSQGFGGDIGVMVGFDMEKDVVAGVGITTHKETPGLGSRTADDDFTNNFKNKAITEIFKIKGEDGIVDAISGATISSKAVCAAVQDAIKKYKDIKSEVNK